jgi:hypothetical protein
LRGVVLNALSQVLHGLLQFRTRLLLRDDHLPHFRVFIGQRAHFPVAFLRIAQLALQVRHQRLVAQQALPVAERFVHTHLC